MTIAGALLIWLLAFAGTGADAGAAKVDAATAKVGAIAARSANRAGARGLVKDAAAITGADVVDIASGQTKGSLTPAELKKLGADLKKGTVHAGALVVTTPPWDAVLVISAGKGKRYVAQLVGDQWLRLESPDPLARAAGVPDKKPSAKPPKNGLAAFARDTSEVSLPSGDRTVWQALERILGPTKNREYLSPPPPPGP